MPPGKMKRWMKSAAAVSSKRALVDRDHLKHRDTARMQPCRSVCEVGRPVALADCLQHLDRDDAVELPLTSR